MNVKYPDITVRLTGGDGNAMVVIAAVTKPLRRAHGDAVASEFVNEAMSGDYDNVLRTAMKWVNVE